MNNVPFLCTKLFQKRGHYSRGDIIQGGNTVHKLEIWYLLVQAPSKKVTSSTAIYPLTRELPHTPSKTTCKINFPLHWSKLLKNLKLAILNSQWGIFKSIGYSSNKIEIGPVSFLTLIIYTSKCAIKIWQIGKRFDVEKNMYNFINVLLWVGLRVCTAMSKWKS